MTTGDPVASFTIRDVLTTTEACRRTGINGTEVGAQIAFALLGQQHFAEIVVVCVDLLVVYDDSVKGLPALSGFTT